MTHCEVMDVVVVVVVVVVETPKKVCPQGWRHRL